MAGIKSLIGLAGCGSIGLLFLVLGCALPAYNCWWPLFVIIFYALSPLPLVIVKRFDPDMTTSSVYREVALFLTAGIVVSAFALPVVLANANRVIEWGACALTMTGNIICFLTILAYFFVFRDDDSFAYSMW